MWMTNVVMNSKSLFLVGQRTDKNLYILAYIGFTFWPIDIVHSANQLKFHQTWWVCNYSIWCDSWPPTDGNLELEKFLFYWFLIFFSEEKMFFVVWLRSIYNNSCCFVIIIWNKKMTNEINWKLVFRTLIQILANNELIQWTSQYLTTNM